MYMSLVINFNKYNVYEDCVVERNFFIVSLVVCFIVKMGIVIVV